MRDLALDVMRHRLVLSYEALADGVTADDLLHQVLLAVPLPEVPLDDRTRSLDDAAVDDPARLSGSCGGSTGR